MEKHGRYHWISPEAQYALEFELFQSYHRIKERWSFEKIPFPVLCFPIELTHIDRIARTNPPAEKWMHSELAHGAYSADIVHGKV